MAKVGINGFGRIGRLVLRACLEKGTEVKNYLSDFVKQMIIVFLCFFNQGCSCQ